MPEFEASFKPTEENQSWRDLMYDLNFIGGGNVAFPNDEVLGVMSAPMECTDVENLGNLATAWLDLNTDMLATIYRGILNRETPTPGNKNQFGPNPIYPNGLTQRKLAQLFTADARRRMTRGDKAGAIDAMNAAARINECLTNEPVYVGFLTSIAIDALRFKALIRLPAEPGEWENHAAKMAKLREACRRAIQGDAYMFMKWSRQLTKPPTPPFLTNPIEWLKWARLPSKTNPRTHGASLAKDHADAVFLTTQPENLLKSDLGASEFQTIYDKDIFYYANTHRAWYRLQVVLLLMEQVSLVRHTRALIHSGKQIQSEKFPSAVIPGGHWNVTVELTTLKATFQLSPIPAWLVDPNMVGKSWNFWFLPPDGSKSWQFSPQ